MVKIIKKKVYQEGNGNVPVKSFIYLMLLLSTFSLISNSMEESLWSIFEIKCL